MTVNPSRLKAEGWRRVRRLTLIPQGVDAPLSASIEGFQLSMESVPFQGNRRVPPMPEVRGIRTLKKF
ncbi:MAG: hypothetical protein C6I05_03975 [Epsilonproteobacteria bacterium]|nr:hypothetical protein [Campylobacterota bacterium]